MYVLISVIRIWLTWPTKRATEQLVMCIDKLREETDEIIRQPCRNRIS